MKFFDAIARVLSGRPRLRVGSRLFNSEGELYGTVAGLARKHRFPNGKAEPAALVDFGDRLGGPVAPRWLPRRSAERFKVE